MTNVYLNLPDFYEFATLKRWGDPYADSGWGYLNNKGIETPDGKYFCAIVSIRETSNRVIADYLTRCMDMITSCVELISDKEEGAT